MKREIIRNYKIFLRFLKLKGLYGVYKYNMFKFPTQSTPELLKIVTKRKVPVHYYIENRFLAYAFTWSGTKQGDGFWRALHTEWSKSFCGNKQDSWINTSLKYPIRNVLSHDDIYEKK